MSAATQPTHSQSAGETPDVTANPRVVEVVQPLIDRVQDVIREKNISYDEWHQAIQFMMDLAACGEVPLLMAYFEATVDEVANATSASSTSAIEGPYYAPGAPMLEPPYLMPQRAEEPGEPLVFSGTVKTPDSQPIAGALLDVWHADATAPGTYSNVHPGQPDFNLRGKLHTDEHGRFELTTIRPAPYRIPDQGPTGRLLNALGRHTWRPAHIHVKITADGYQPLTTQLYFQGDEFLDSDVASAVKDDLILPLQTAESNEGSHLTLRYDFQLAQAGP
ncbi:MAG: catechol 1,2-dioxygenase [Solirubrobacterales bacterium]|nr:catechol 1,2-dioxygenase [Solirubrobacterales bacterium]MBV9810821.1 catechol 1,2-dioxygenase [Solirubrobacterales bacterium]